MARNHKNVIIFGLVRISDQKFYFSDFARTLQELHQMLSAAKNDDDIARIKRQIEMVIQQMGAQPMWNLPFAPEGNRK